jgi:hypothetical protein
VPLERYEEVRTLFARAPEAPKLVRPPADSLQPSTGDRANDSHIAHSHDYGRRGYGFMAGSFLVSPEE